MVQQDGRQSSGEVREVGQLLLGCQEQLHAGKLVEVEEVAQNDGLIYKVLREGVEGGERGEGEPVLGCLEQLGPMGLVLGLHVAQIDPFLDLQSQSRYRVLQKGYEVRLVLLQDGFQAVVGFGALEFNSQVDDLH